MSPVTITNLSPKLQPFLIGSPTCPIQAKEIDEIFQDSSKLKPLKDDYIFDAGKWILKLGRTDGLFTTPDTHLYRVRKAEKIRTFIDHNKLGDHLVVPKKYLYWNAQEKQFYVVAEKINLSSNVAAYAPEFEQPFITAGKNSKTGQLKALSQKAPQQSFTNIQAKALAELSILGYTDLSYNNLYFTSDGKVAIIDTEPHKRWLNKQKQSFFLSFLFSDKRILLTLQSISGIARLKSCIKNPLTLKTVQKIENCHVLWRTSELISKIVITTLILFITYNKTILTSTNLVKEIFKISLFTIGILKNYYLILHLIRLTKVWIYSQLGPDGLSEIARMERRGLF